jgi:hypothetical protein
MSIRSLIIIASTMLLAPTLASAQMPRVITYQGILTNADGTTFAGTQATVGWQLLSDSSTIVASDVATVTTIRRGAFSLAIDLSSTLVNFARPLFLRILFDGESFEPVRLTAVPYAFYADSSRTAGFALLSARASVADSSVRSAFAAAAAIATSATSATTATTATSADSARAAGNGVPVGTIIAYFGEVTDSIPNTGWLVCRGQSIAGYPKLSATLGPLAPDLRGMFLRGANLGRSDTLADPGGRTGGTPLQKIGSLQSDAFGRHNHSSDTSGFVPPGAFGLIRRSLVTDTTTAATTDSVASGTEPNLRLSPGTIPMQGAAETRPNNMAVNWLIKAW